MELIDDALAVSPPGADGACVSSYTAGSRTKGATAGTPLPFTRNSMYVPGGARLASAGAGTMSPPDTTRKLSGTYRWSMLNEGVTEPSRKTKKEVQAGGSGG